MKVIFEKNLTFFEIAAMKLVKYYYGEDNDGKRIFHQSF